MDRRLLGAVALFACPYLGCATTSSEEKKGDPSGAMAEPPAKVESTRCDPKDKRVIELDVNKDGKPDVWKFYAATIDQGTKIEILTCKEVDLNFDSKKDMWVHYESSGNVSLEEFDLDFDGKIDLWTYRQQGKVVRQELDTNFDTKPDIWKFFENDKLAYVDGDVVTAVRRPPDAGDRRSETIDVATRQGKPGFFSRLFNAIPFIGDDAANAPPKQDSGHVETEAQTSPADPVPEVGAPPPTP